MKLNNRGFTLSEAIVGMVIAALAIYFLSTPMISIFQDYNKISNNSMDQIDSYQIMSFLQKNMLRSDVHYYGFAGYKSNPPLARLVIPYPGKCANLTSNCSGQMAYLWAYRDPKSSAVPLVCALNQETVLVDASDNSSGTIAIDGTKIEVKVKGESYFSPKIDLDVDQLVALTDEPNSVVFRVAQGPAKYDPKWNSTTKSYDDPLFNNNPDCLDYLGDRDELYSIKIKPFLVPDTGNTQPGNITVLNAMGKFPVTLHGIKFFSIGTSPQGSGFSLDLNKCSAGTTLSCDENFMSLPKIKWLAAQQILSIPFDGQNTIKAFSLGASSECVASGCDVLSVPTTHLVSLPGESFGKLKAGTFSLIKQEFINSIVFYIGSETKDRAGNINTSPQVHHVISF